MKKIMAMILVIIALFSTTSCAAKSYTEWLDIENVTNVRLLDKDRLVVTVNDYNEALCTGRGDPLTEFKFTDIVRVNDNLYHGRHGSVFEGEKFSHALDRNGNILQSESGMNSIVIPGENLEVDIDEIEKTGLSLDMIWGHYTFVRNDNHKVALADLEGNVLSGFDYVWTLNCYIDPALLGKVMLYNDESDYKLIADPYLKRYVDRVIGKSLRPYPAAVVFLNENNKYSVAEFKNLKIKAGEYDEFVCMTNGRFTFKKDGLVYVTDEYGNVTYSGENDVRIAEFDSYVVEKNGKLGVFDKEFNEIFPCEYEDVTIVASDLYILKKDGECMLVGQGKNLISGKKSMESLGNYISVGDAIYDLEGNFLAELPGCSKVFYADYCYTYFNEEKQRIGRLVDGSLTPIVEVNGEYLHTDTLARIKNDTVLIPLRAFAEKSGFNVLYDSESKEIKLTKDNKIIIFEDGKKTAVSDGKEIRFDTACKTVNNRILVPLKAISDVFGFVIRWNGEKRVVNIITE